MQQTLTIGKLAKKTNVSIDSIRFYERRGLLAAPMRTEANYRCYPLDTAARLRSPAACILKINNIFRF